MLMKNNNGDDVDSNNIRNVKKLGLCGGILYWLVIMFMVIIMINVKHVEASGVYKTEALVGRYENVENLPINHTYAPTYYIFYDSVSKVMYFETNDNIPQVRKISMLTGLVSSVVGNPAMNHGFNESTQNFPLGYTLDQLKQMEMWKGNLIWIEGGRFIRILNSSTNMVSNLFGSTSVGPVSGGNVTNPLDIYTSYLSSITVDPVTNDIYIADFYNYLIRKISANGTASIYAGGNSNSDPVDGPISNAYWGQVDLLKVCNNSLYVLGYFTTQYFIQKIYKDTDGSLLTRIVAGGGSDENSYKYDSIKGVDLVIDPTHKPTSLDCYNGELYFHTNNYQIKKLTSDGQVIRIIGDPSYKRGETNDGPFTSTSLCGVTSISIDQSNGDIYFSENGQNIRKIIGSSLSTISHHNNILKYPTSTPLEIRAAVPSYDNSGFYVLEGYGILFYNFSTSLLTRFAGYSYLYHGLVSPVGSDHSSGGTFEDARFTYIEDLVQVPNGDIIVVDKYEAYTIKLLSTSGNLTFITSIPQTQYGDFIRSMTYYNQYIYLCSESYILRLDGNYLISVFLGGGNSEDDGPANNVSLASLRSCHVQSTIGRVYFIQYTNATYLLRIYYPDTEFVSTCMELPFDSSSFYVNERGNIYFILSSHIVIFIPSTINSCSGSFKYYQGNPSAFSSVLGGTTQFSENMKSVYFVNGLNRIILSEYSTISQITMECDVGYSGPYCENFSCFSYALNDSAVCSSRGNCSSANNCSCSIPYYGANCEHFDCFSVSANSSKVCGGNGICSSPDNCTCYAEHFGRECNITTCYGTFGNVSTVCSSNGKCVGKDKCECDSSHYGNQCESPYCFGIMKNNSNVCSGHGNCTGPNQCVCDTDYLGAQCNTKKCFGLSPANSSVCSSHGACLNGNCICFASYIGHSCNIPLCFGIPANSSNVCSGHGECTLVNHCECNQTWYGSDCSVPKHDCFGIQFNDSTVCSGNGLCSSSDNCTCFTGFSGNNCSMKVIIPQNETLTLNDTIESNVNATLNSTNTTSPESNLTIASNTTTNSSEIFNNQTTVNNETKIIENSNSSSTTNTTKVVIITELLTCFGVSNLDQAIVCSGKGACVGKNLCECMKGFYGERCNISSCFGKREDDSSVCSGKGKCLSDGKCSCQSGYGGLECDSKTCFGIPSSDSTVCNGRGNCTDFDTCQCYAIDGVKITGDACENLLCKGVLNSEDYYFSHTDSRVCSKHGKCSFNITALTGGCACEDGYYGEKCEQFNCYSIPNTNSSSCSGHGICADVDTCKCNDDASNGHYFGADCYSCHPAFAGKSCTERTCTVSTCLNGGSCGSDNQCVCSGNFTGLICDKCASDHYGVNCDLYCNDKVTCSGKGICNSNALCDCYSDREHGFWNGSNCNSCLFGYYGSECMTYFASFDHLTDSPVETTIYGQVSKYFDGISFKLFGPSSYISNIVSCSKLIHPEDISMFGAESKCYWTDKLNGQFNIEFDNDFNFDISKTTFIRLNTNIFSKSSSTQDYLKLYLTLSDNIASPTANIKSAKKVYSTSENVYLSGVNSFSGDKKGLIYYWDISGQSISDPVLKQVTTNKESTMKIEKGLLTSGIYTIYLYVKSQVSKLASSTEYFTFQVQDVEFPSIVIAGAKEISVKSTDKLITIKKTTTVPSSLKDREFTIEWQQTEGPIIKFKKDSYNNLLIEQFNSGKWKYVFKVAISVVDNPILTSSDYITITTEQPKLVLSLTIMKQVSPLTSNTSSIPIQVNFQDPESNTDEKEVWRWTCIDSETEGYCGDLISQKLSLHSKNRSISISFTQQDFSSSIKKPTLTLNIIKGERSVSGSLTLNIVHSPPLISIINISPKSSIVNNNDKISIEIKHQEEDPSNSTLSVKTQWKIDNIVVSESETVRISTDYEAETTSNIPSSPFSNLKFVNKNQISSILVDSKELEEGIDHSIQVKVSFASGNQEISSSDIINKYKKAKPPKKSDCKVSPSIGVSMKTDFSLNCENFQNEENTIELRQGYIDTQTGIKVYLPLSQGSTVSIPSLASLSSGSSRRMVDGQTDNGVSIFFELKDSQSGESRVMLSNVTITSNTATDISEVVEHVSNQTEKIMSTSVRDGDTAVSIADTVNAIVSAQELLKSLPAAAVDQQSVTTVQTKLLDTLSSSLSTSPQDSLSSSTTSMATYAVHSLLKNEDTVEKPVVHKSVTIVGNVIQMVIKSKVDIFAAYEPVSSTVGVLGDHISKFADILERFKGYESISDLVEGMVVSHVNVQPVSGDPVALQKSVANCKADRMYLADFSNSFITSPVSKRSLSYEAYVNVPVIPMDENNEYSDLTYSILVKEHVPEITATIVKNLNATVVSPVSVSFSVITSNERQIDLSQNFSVHLSVLDEDFASIDYNSYACINIGSNLELDRYNCIISGRDKATTAIICNCRLVDLKITNLIIIKDIEKAAASKKEEHPVAENNTSIENRLMIIIIVVVCVVTGVVSIISIVMISLALYFCLKTKKRKKVLPYKYKEMRTQEIAKPSKINDTSTTSVSLL